MMEATCSDQATRFVIRMNPDSVMRILRHWFRRPILLIQSHLSRAGAHGLYLIFGITILIAAAWLFGGISEDLLSGDPLIQLDNFISEWLRSHRDPRFMCGMQLASGIASTAAVTMLSVAVGVALLCVRQFYWLIALVAVSLGGFALNLLLKTIFDRARPGWADPVVALSDPSFPSGHTMMGTLIYGFIAVFLILRCSSWRWRIAIAVLTLSLILSIALSRLYLGLHFLSDVMAAMAAGVAWLALCLTAMEALRRHRVHKFPLEIHDTAEK